MAFRTNKTPVLQTKSASGAVASFNTALAMPLINGEFTIQAYQEGSGDPSPVNVRNIVGFDKLRIGMVNFNQLNNSDRYPDYAEVNLGEDVYGGVYNSVTGKLRLTHGYSEVLASWVWRKSTNYPGGYYVALSHTPTGAKSFAPFKCSHAKSVDSIDLYADGTCFCDGSLNFRLMTEPSTINDWKAYLDSQKANNTPVCICYELAEPIEIQLTPTQIETFIGNNTIFADTGDTSLSYNDLDIAKRGSFREVFKLP